LQHPRGGCNLQHPPPYPPCWRLQVDSIVVEIRPQECSELPVEDVAVRGGQCVCVWMRRAAM
jgi:hypothetical protein